MDIKSGYWKSANAVAANIILGFVPDWLMLYTNVVAAPILYWWNRAHGASALAGKYGWTDASTGAWAACADADNGVIAFNSTGLYAMVLSPIVGIGKKATLVRDYLRLTAALDGRAVARAATITGTITQPTTKNGYLYECTTVHASDTTVDPTWPKIIGATVTDNEGRVWTCIEHSMVRGGGKGFTFGKTIAVTDEYIHFIAFKTDRDKYLGDAADGDIRFDN